MRNDRKLLFDDITVEQTDLLLDSINDLPINKSVARRIRGHVLEGGKQRSHKRRHVGRILIPIAACLVAIVLLFTAFPKAAYAVSAFFGRVFTPSRYMNEDPADRTPIPSIDEAIAAAAPKDGDCRIEYITERPNAKEVLDSRAPNGLAPYNAKDWLWMSDIRPEIAEVLYDGNQLMWNTNLYMDNVHVREFMEDFGIESGSKFAVDALVEDCSYTIAGDPTVYPLSSDGGGIQPIYTDEELAQADHVVLNTDFTLNSDERPLPSGVLTITQEIVLYEINGIVGQSPIAFLYHTFTFDTTKGNTVSTDGDAVTIPLSGETYFSVDHKEKNAEGELTSWTVETKKVSLDGMKLLAEFEYLPTGIMVHLKMSEMPPDWTSEMKRSFMRMTPRNNYNVYVMSGFASDLYIDGKFIGETPQPDGGSGGELTYIIPVFPDQYAITKSVVMKVALVYYETYNGSNQVGGEIYKIPDGISPTDTVTNVTPLADIIIPLP